MWVGPVRANSLQKKRHGSRNINSIVRAGGERKVGE